MIKHTIAESSKHIDPNEDILLSVIVIAFNHQNYIAQTLESILMQIVDFRTEVIIHDDCSTDNTREILDEYQLRFQDIIQVIYPSENQYSKDIKIMSQIVKSYSRGKYIAICEGDDYWLSNTKLIKQVRFLEQNIKFSGSVHNHIQLDLSNYKTSKVKTEFFRKLSIGRVIISGNNIATNSYVYRREIITKLPDYYLHSDISDYPFIIHMRLEGLIRHFKGHYSIYRYGVNNSWTNRVHSNPQKLINHLQNKIQTLLLVRNHVPENHRKYVDFVILEAQKLLYKAEADSMNQFDNNKQSNNREIRKNGLKIIRIIYKILPNYIKNSYIVIRLISNIQHKVNSNVLK